MKRERIALDLRLLRDYFRQEWLCGCQLPPMWYRSDRPMADEQRVYCAKHSPAAPPWRDNVTLMTQRIADELTGEPEVL